MNCCRKSRVLFLAWCCTQVTALHAEELYLAVASNFMKPMNAIVSSFEDASGHEVHVSYGASGRLYAQIVNGAPFELFFSADQDKPAALITEGQAIAGTLFTYATGSLVLWSAESGLDLDEGRILGNARYSRLALANPRLAPYGAAALQVLELLEQQGIKVAMTVMGENISQAYQFVETGNVLMGLVALSQVMESGKISSGTGWVIPPEMHDPIRQDAVLLLRGKDSQAALEFLAYLRSDAVQALIVTYGYRTD